jgi:hypothetical protein
MGGFVGWMTQTLMLEKPVWWALPVFFVGCGVFTLNGDNVGESLVVLSIIGVLLLLIAPAITAWVGPRNHRWRIHRSVRL